MIPDSFIQDLLARVDIVDLVDSFVPLKKAGANLLPLRLHIRPEQPLSEMLTAAQHALLEGYEHQGVTFGELLKELQLPRDPSRSPLMAIFITSGSRVCWCCFSSG